MDEVLGVEGEEGEGEDGDDFPPAAGGTAVASPAIPPGVAASPSSIPSASPGTPIAPLAPRVAIIDFKFSPDVTTVRAGTTVTWANDGIAQHTTTSATGLWDSGLLVTGATFSRLFPTAGAFPYSCTVHPNMTGTVVVT